MIDPSFQGVNKLFVLSCEDNAKRISLDRHSLSTAEIIVMIHKRNFFDHSVEMIHKHTIILEKTATGQGYDYTTGCLLNYPYFKKIT